MTIKVTRTGDETTLSQIMRLVKEAQASKSQYQNQADRQFGVQRIYADGIEGLPALAIAASLESLSEHPLGQAIQPKS